MSTKAGELHLRVVSDAGQNLRINADTGATTVDQAIAYGAGDRSAGARPEVVGAAYTNNDNDSYVDPPLIPFDRPVATGTKLYTIDSARDSLALQDPPNDGTLRTVGRLRQRTTSAVGFDVYSLPDSEGNTASNTGYASLSRGAVRSSTRSVCGRAGPSGSGVAGVRSGPWRTSRSGRSRPAPLRAKHPLLLEKVTIACV